MHKRVVPVLLGAALIVGIAASPALATKGDLVKGGGQDFSQISYTFSAKDSGSGVSGQVDVQYGNGGLHYYGNVVCFSVSYPYATIVFFTSKNSSSPGTYQTLRLLDNGEGSNASSDKAQRVSGYDCSIVLPSNTLQTGNVQIYDA